MLIQVINKKTSESKRIYEEDLSFFQRRGFEVCKSEVVKDEPETDSNDEVNETSVEEEPVFRKKGRRNRD